MSLNKVILVGHLGQDPETRYTQAGVAVCNFSVATNRVTKDSSGNETQETEWHRVTVWREQAENCQKYLKKGRQVCVEGSLKTNKWQDKEGNDRTTTGITAHKVMFLSSGEKSDTQPERHQAAPQSNTPRMGFDLKEDFSKEDIPF